VAVSVGQHALQHVDRSSLLKPLMRLKSKIPAMIANRMMIRVRFIHYAKTISGTDVWQLHSYPLTRLRSKSAAMIDNKRMIKVFSI